MYGITTLALGESSAESSRLELAVVYQSSFICCAGFPLFLGPRLCVSSLSLPSSIGA